MEAINHQEPVPQWYKKLQTEVSIGPNQVLTSPLKNPISKALPSSSIPNDLSISYYRHRTKIWISFWDPRINDIIVGRIIEIFNPQQGINTAYIEHWKYNPLEQDRLLNTPKKLIPIFTSCSGCNRHTYFYRDLRPKCVINIPLYNLHRISLQHKNYNPFSHLTISFRNYIITKDPFCSLRVTTYNLYR
ncbi:hypothetical protein C1645_825398 [Glomus cerebriforme]|uniref:Uncharacterized protein n=1 Tax=Glomus cerebriforme TaxID=658196 RepID=A0A397SSR4_9GLOM|nr:hypothetical protein C1645_825398 [Glomus cerebriforme]